MTKFQFYPREKLLSDYLSYKKRIVVAMGIAYNHQEYPDANAALATITEGFTFAQIAKLIDAQTPLRATLGTCKVCQFPPFVACEWVARSRMSHG